MGKAKLVQSKAVIGEHHALAALGLGSRRWTAAATEAGSWISGIALPGTMINAVFQTSRHPVSPSSPSTRPMTPPVQRWSRSSHFIVRTLHPIPA
ncbi:hypothetical protein GCM10020258_40400 [Sphingomonas yabuuchiae]